MFLSSKLAVNISAKIVHLPSEDIPAIHDYRFFLVQEGTVRLKWDHRETICTLKPNDLVMLPPNTGVRCLSAEPSTLLSLQVDAPHIDGLIPHNQILRCNSAEHIGDASIYRELADIMTRISLSVLAQEDSLLLSSLVHKFSYLLQSNFLCSAEEQAVPSDQRNHTHQRLAQITDYLQTHYQQDISLQSLADQLHLSSQYLSRFFKKNFGVSFTDYLSNLRLGHAVSQLLHTKHTLINIAMDNGFPSTSTFGRIFHQQYGMSPGRYRQKYQELDPVAGSLTRDLPSEPSPISNPIHLDAGKASEHSRPWSMGINIGPFSNALRNSFYDCFSEYEKHICIRYVRFSNLFDPDVTPYYSSTEELDFTNIDSVLRLFKEKQVYPYIELTPCIQDAVQLSKTSTPDTSSQTGQDIDFHCLSLHALLVYTINHYGLDYIKNWRFEVSWDHREDPKDYINRYRRYYETIHHTMPECRIDGPGFNICDDPKSFAALLSEMDAAALPVDHFTFTALPHQASPTIPKNLSSRGILSPDPDYTVTLFKSYLDLLKQTVHYSTAETFITSVGAGAGMSNYISSSLFSATFLCRNMLSLMPLCSGVFYSYFMDIKRRWVQDGNCDDYVGLVYENGIPKPVLHAYQFLNRLGPFLIDSGKNYAFAKSSANTYQLLCLNYTHFSNSFCLNPWRRIHIEETYHEAFESGDSLNLHLSCINIPDGRYKVTQFSLNHTHGSILDKYIRIFEKGNISREDLETMIANLKEDESQYYRRTCLPRQEIYFLDVDHELSLNITLAPHEVHFYEITRVL